MRPCLAASAGKHWNSGSACRDLVAHEPTGAWSKMAPFRVLSVDIECQGRKGCFPEAEKDAVIQIATTVQAIGDDAPLLRHVLTLDTCAPIAAATVESFPREADMLLRCASALRLCPPPLPSASALPRCSAAHPALANASSPIFCTHKLGDAGPAVARTH